MLGKPGHCWTEETGPLQSGEERKQFKNACLRITCDKDRTAQIAS